MVMFYFTHAFVMPKLQFYILTHDIVCHTIIVFFSRACFEDV